MKLNKNYLHFKRWFKSVENMIHQGQWSDEQIAYSAYQQGLNIAAAVTVDISNTCTCTSFRETPLINGKYICTICNKPLDLKIAAPLVPPDRTLKEGQEPPKPPFLH